MNNIPEKIIEKFTVKYLQILDENGKCDGKLMPPLNNAQIKKMYELIVLTKTFDDKALKLQRQGRLGTYAPVNGQEACQIGSALAVQDEDLIVPAFRENGVFLARGMPLEMLFQYWGGDERGMHIPDNINMFPISITVGAQPLHAAGAAAAFKIKKEKKVAVTYFGDGATSEGDFHEAMNFAGTWNLPVIFICQNNQYAISVPVKEQTGSSTIAQKAIAYGFEGIKVDGNDIFAVYKATQDAIKKARSGKGPTLIECFTYRLGDHTTSDDAKKYRKESEVAQWKKKDPLLRLKKYMHKKKLLTKAYEEKIIQDSERIINEAAQKYLNIAPQKPEEIFNYIFAELTPNLKEQREEIKKEIFQKSDKPSAISKTSVVGSLEEA